MELDSLCPPAPTVNGPCFRACVQHWETRPALVCRHPNEFHVRSIKSSYRRVKLTGQGAASRPVTVGMYREIILFRIKYLYM